MGRIVDSEYFKVFYNDSGWWGNHFVEDSAVEVYNDAGDWVLDGEVDLAECGNVYAGDTSQYLDFSTEEFFTKWELQSDTSEFCVIRLKMRKDEKDLVLQHLLDVTMEAGAHVEVL